MFAWSGVFATSGELVRLVLGTRSRHGSGCECEPVGNASSDRANCSVTRAIVGTKLFVPFLSTCFGGILMKRNVVQLMLGLAAMAVVLVGLETQANAFGHGSCGSNGGGHGGRHHRSHGSCGSSGGQSSCESSCSSCEQSSCSSCESSCGSSGGRRHHHHGGCNSGCGGGCNSGCGSSSGGCESGCSSCGGGS